MTARVTLPGRGETNVATGLPVLDHLLALAAAYGGFDLAVEVAPAEAGAEVAAAGRELGVAVAGLLGGGGALGHGSATAAADEALAAVVVEASGRPLVVSNVDLSGERVGGLGSDLAAGFLEALAEAGGLTLHVRLVEGRDPQHVLESIFKALGAALGEAARSR